MIGRRQFVKNIGLGTATIGVAGLSSAASCRPNGNASHPSPDKDDEQVLFIGDDIAIAETTAGKVQGYLLHDVYTFLGIPYGGDTSGNNRFMPPTKPEPWSNVRPAVFYGHSAPQDMENRWPNNFGTFADHWNYWDVSEDCLCLNVWTPAIHDGHKRPVLLWLHGGGFTNGSAIEQDGYHGANLSRYGDVVFVSINHRLGPLGFSDLSEVGGEKYKHSGNVGMLDIVFAMEWIRDNIAAFGGDSTNVTVMGQSGGGSKVCTTAAMPAAKGLIHKAVPLSGSTIEASDPAVTKKIGAYILKEAGLTRAEIDKLQHIPWKDYIELANRAAVTYLRESGAATRRTFGPVADNIHVPAGTFYTADTLADTPAVPMLLCSTFHEWNPNRGDVSFESMSLSDVTEKLVPRYADKAGRIVEAYANTFPQYRPVELWALILSSREAVVRTADAKLKQGKPVYMAWFGWEPPLFNNRMRAFHCLDICFWFRNTDRMVTHTGGGKRPRQLADKMSEALLSFMRTGNPNTSELPYWPAYTKEKGEVMILNDESNVQTDPDREARKAFGD